MQCKANDAGALPRASAFSLPTTTSAVAATNSPEDCGAPIAVGPSQAAASESDALCHQFRMPADVA